MLWLQRHIQPKLYKMKTFEHRHLKILKKNVNKLVNKLSQRVSQYCFDIYNCYWQIESKPFPVYFADVFACLVGGLKKKRQRERKGLVAYPNIFHWKEEEKLEKLDNKKDGRGLTGREITQKNVKLTLGSCIRSLFSSLCASVTARHSPPQ